MTLPVSLCLIIIFPSFSYDFKIAHIFQKYFLDINFFISTCLISSTSKSAAYLCTVPSSTYFIILPVCTTFSSPRNTFLPSITSNSHFDNPNSIFVSSQKILTVFSKHSNWLHFLKKSFRSSISDHPYVKDDWVFYLPSSAGRISLFSKFIASGTIAITNYNGDKVPPWNIPRLILTLPILRYVLCSAIEYSPPQRRYSFR